MVVLMAFIVSLGAAQDGPPRLVVERGPDRSAWAYDQLIVDCERIVQLHGRNGAWGRRELPLAAISEGVVLTGSALSGEDVRGGGAMASFQCTDGSNCIGVGALDVATPQAAEHRIGFSGPDYAQRFIEALSQFRASCAARNLSPRAASH